MGLGEMFEGFLFKIALKKGVKAAVAVAGSAVAANAGLAQFGVTVDITKLETALLSTGAALITMVLNWMKTKTKLGMKFL